MCNVTIGDRGPCVMCNVSLSIDYPELQHELVAECSLADRGETPLPERPRPPEPGPAANQRARRLVTANHRPRPHSPTPLYFILTTIWLDIFPPGHT